ncbi:G patch domain-containing protein TGH [Cornus florida]|uniref:G patch domain-containing protein TGH n=1 Tax=Cornus florida TaxID=4283 RepID=UPI00289B1D08|nr:G patch domain-containing protein TGH [Cornus florida]
MGSDEEDFVFFGKPIEREEDNSSRKKKALAEATGQLRTLPSWKQEVRDEEGRRRFHGAFTGGYSAGYYNTVGTKEGWTPQSFTSSRKNRAEVKQQNIINFLDDDEKEEMEGRSLGTSMQFDTFGFTAAELARKQAEKEQQQRPSAIPGPAPDEIVLPATDSIGVKLLLKMGWRHGHSIRDSHPNSLYDARREARKAFLAFSSDDTTNQLTHPEVAKVDLENVMELPTDGVNQVSQSTPVYVINPKQDMYGLGYDPYKHAPEFREKKRSRLSGNRELAHKKPISMKDSLLGVKSGRVATGFGIGALEELDIEDEDVYTAGYNFEETYVQEIEEPSTLRLENKKKFSGKELGVLPGFKGASNSDYQLERFDPPVVPKDFVPHHRFPAPLDTDNKVADAPPPEIPPPEDNNLKIMIEGVATLVARSGKLFEDLSREKNQSNPLFSFLNGGNGHDYYARKLWEERQKRNDQTKKQLDAKIFPSVQKMTAESRGKILGEKPLERSSIDVSSSVTSADSAQLQFHLTDTFTTPASFCEVPEAAKPFRDDPAKQERFEQFLKEKYQGGLRSKDSAGASNMSEAARAREKLEFESAALAIEKGKWGKESGFFDQKIMALSPISGLQFTSGALEQTKISQAEELMMKKMYPKREEYQWRPSSILCKRFDIMDPYLGKPPPAPRVRSKIDSLIFMPDSVKSAKPEGTVATNRESLPGHQSSVEEINKEASDGEIQGEVQAENVERPVDLYKAIFSDDSEDEENSSPNQVEDAEKKIEAANTTLSRLMAGDFLESLGKELGLEVPPDMPLHSENKARTSTTQKESVNAYEGDTNTLPVETPSALNAVSGILINQEVPQGKPHHQEISKGGGSHKHELVDANTHRSGSKSTETGSSVKIPGKVEQNVSAENRKDKISTGRRQHWSSSSSEDERSRKRSRRHRHRSSNSYSDTTDSSDDYRDRQHSKSKGRKKGSSREKSSSRKHSKRKHGSKDSPSRHSRYVNEREHSEAKREKRR